MPYVYKVRKAKLWERIGIEFIGVVLFFTIVLSGLVVFLLWEKEEITTKEEIKSTDYPITYQM